MIIDAMQPIDWEQVRSIYLEGLATGNASFETEAPTWEQWDESHLPLTRLVAREVTKWGQAPRRLGASPHFVRRSKSQTTDWPVVHTCRYLVARLLCSGFFLSMFEQMFSG